jgi:peptide/nickel transport system substrate-binding protein
MYESYEPGISVKLVKNPNYFIEGMPYLDAIEHRVIPDAEARITALRAGDMDVASYIDFQSLPMLREDPNIFIPEGKGFYGSRLSFGLTLPPTDDVRVRHAINYAIDREMIVDAVVAREGEAIWGSIIPEGRFGYDPDLADYYSYDPAKALELFNEAGWIDTDGDGILDKDGEPILITLVTYGPSWWSQTAEVFQANLRDIGVVLEINVLPWAEFAVVREEIAVLPEGEPDKYNLIGSSLWGLDMTDFVRYINGDLNQNRYHNSELNELMYSAISTLDDNDREKMFQEAQAMVLDDAPWITTCWVSRAEAVRSNVNNFMHLNDTGCFGILLWEAYLDD